MTKPHNIQLDFTCWCLIVLKRNGLCDATVYMRGKSEKAYRVFDYGEFKSSGYAVAWAQTFEPTIECVKVVDFER